MKKKIFLAVLYMVLSLLLLTVVAFLAEHKVVSDLVGAILVLFSMVPLWFSCVYMTRLDIALHIFECRNCGHGFRPTFKEYMYGAHTLKTRRLRCPKCGEKTWCLIKRDEE